MKSGDYISVMLAVPRDSKTEFIRNITANN